MQCDSPPSTHRRIMMCDCVPWSCAKEMQFFVGDHRSFLARLRVMGMKERRTWCSRVGLNLPSSLLVSDRGCVTLSTARECAVSLVLFSFVLLGTWSKERSVTTSALIIKEPELLHFSVSLLKPSFLFFGCRLQLARPCICSGLAADLRWVLVAGSNICGIAVPGILMTSVCIDNRIVCKRKSRVIQMRDVPPPRTVYEREMLWISS